MAASAVQSFPVRRRLAALLLCSVFLAGDVFSLSTPEPKTSKARNSSDQPKQVPLSLMRERAGAKFRSQARDAIAPLPLSQADKRLLDRLKRLSRKGDWDGVESAFSSYKGN